MPRISGRSSLTFCSRTDIVVAAICPEWFKLIELLVYIVLRVLKHLLINTTDRRQVKSKHAQALG